MESDEAGRADGMRSSNATEEEYMGRGVVMVVVGAASPAPALADAVAFVVAAAVEAGKGEEEEGSFEEEEVVVVVEAFPAPAPAAPPAVLVEEDVGGSVEVLGGLEEVEVVERKGLKCVAADVDEEVDDFFCV